jgi:hypothetical protein
MKVAVVVFVGFDTVLWQMSISVEQTACIVLDPGNLFFITKIPDRLAWRFVRQGCSFESGL